MNLLIWASFICAFIWQVDTLYTQALVLASTQLIISEIRKGRAPDTKEESSQ